MNIIPPPSLFDSAPVFAIYCIVHTPSNRVYIGSAINVQDRIIHHKRLLKGGKHTNNELQGAWTKSGESSFLFRILEIVGNPRDLVVQEQFWIDKYQSANLEFGFNLSSAAVHSYGIDGSPFHFRISQKDIEQILIRLSNWESRSDIAKSYSVSYSVIEKISKSYNWSYNTSLLR